MDYTPSLFDPEINTSREKYRRYGKMQSSSSTPPIHEGFDAKFRENNFFFNGSDTTTNIQNPDNAALVLDDLKQEIENQEFDGFEASAFRPPDSLRRISGFEPISALKTIKQEDDLFTDSGESIFSLFASLLDSAIQGLMPFADLILHFKNTCRKISESFRFGDTGKHRIVEDKLMRQKAQLLLDEAASWSLLWHIFGKGNEGIPDNLILNPSTSHQEVCQFFVSDMTAQLCVRIVLWLEELASEALDLEKKIKGAHVGSYLPSSGIWHHTQRYLKKKKNDPSIVKHLDFDAPTRESAQEFSDDKKQDESLLEDIWILLRAGRKDEACELCRSAGQPWRTAILCPFGGLDQFPSVEALQKNENTKSLQAFELESGIGHQWLLWKWSSFCASEKIAELDGGKYEMAIFASQCSNLKRILPVCTDWESACWALAKSWLDVQVDLVLAQFQQGSSCDVKSFEDSVNGLIQQGIGNSQYSSESWPHHVLEQQPHDISSLIQKLHSSDIVHEAVSRASKDQHRQIEMNLMNVDIANLLDLLWSWVSPSEDIQNVLRPHGDPQMICFSAHLVIVLRYLLADEMDDNLKEKSLTIGDLIIYMYAMVLFSKQHEELVGIYASQLASHRCIDLFVQMMELRLNDSVQVKYKIFLSAMVLPFSSEVDEKACFEEIIERVLSRSREITYTDLDERFSNVAEQHRIQSLQKAKAVQWLCFTPPTTLTNFEMVNAKLLLKALMHCNILFREFALISMWRIPKFPVGAHMLLSFLAEPLKQPTDTLLSLEEHNIYENMQELEDWREYYTYDATYRNWLKIELENADVAPGELSVEEKDRAIDVARDTLNSSLKLLLRKKFPWLTTSEICPYKSTDDVFIELQATAMLCQPSGECLCPDATLCTALSSALYSSICEEDVFKRHLTVNVAISPEDKFCVGLSMRCTAVDGDGLGLHESNDGGLLATILASAFKGELSRFQPGVTLEISRLDAWYSNNDCLEYPATYVVRGLCRKCCLPEMILRCMQISVSLCENGDSTDCRSQLIELVADSELGFFSLFSQQQMQEFIRFERECTLFRMQFQEDSSMNEA
ncbi:hypothetical protein ZOSMA_83G00150 [Zostera marina]|uniref:Nuclear pore complex protein n=1 Tax=Zostera marina TaxID=29655 RepID=A0A0K9NNK6_ZOSMR|nr:hypothetical protein ZOSMA_83G00150 [Zostera marina]